MFICLIFSGLLSILPAPQNQAPAVDPQQMNAIHREDVKNEIERLIQSASASDRAWAAYFIGEYGFKEFAPALIETLNQNFPTSDFVYRAVLDSLIRLRVSVPSERLAPLYERLPDETLILMARSPAIHGETLLSIAENPGRTVCWVAACNLLAESKAPGFAAFLLKHLKIKVAITVSEKETGSGGGGGVGGGVADGFFQVPDGFPPTALYQLTDMPIRDAVAIAPGAHPVFYERQVIDSGVANQRGIGVYDNTVDRDNYCIEYLSFLLGQSANTLELQATYYKIIRWSGIKDYKAEVIGFRELIKGNFERFKGQCVEKELLSDSEAEALKPNLIITVNDLRENKTPPLPEIPNN